MIYGNSFISVLKKFKRNVYCDNCGEETCLDNLNYDTKASIVDENHIVVPCSSCGHVGPKKIIDHKIISPESIYVKRWNPFLMIIRCHIISGDCEYVLLIDRETRRQAELDTFFFVKHAPKIILKAIKEDKDLVLRKDFILHLKEESPAGLNMRGWGLSPVLSNLKHSWYLQVLRRYNEAMGLDYIIPLRFIVPSARRGLPELSDPMYTHDMSNFQASIVDMLRWRRIDPTAWFVLPFPVELIAQEPGNRQFATIQLMDHATNMLLNSIGVPAEFYNMNFQIQAAPTSLRLMEMTFSGLRTVLNKAAKWIVEKVAKDLGWEDLKVSLPRPTVIDDINKQLSKVQLMMQGLLSRTTGLEALGLSYDEEQKRMLEEEKDLAIEIEKMKKSMINQQVGDMVTYGSTIPGMVEKSMQEQAAQAASMLGMGGAPGGAAAGAAGAMGLPGGVPTPQGGVPGGDPISQFLANVPPANQKLSAEELNQIASSLAQQLLSPEMDPTLRNAILRRMKAKNPIVHALTSQMIEELRYQAKVSQQASQT
jgi:hypothetical protein